jgi:tRNA threonylcarbamoyladenosine biosynthesis protein TsaB
MADRAMREARLAVSALDLVTVTTGPGSFTGIRVGLAAAKGIALGLGVPLFGVTSFEAGAAACEADPVKRFLLVALDSRRADLYVQLFDPERRPLGTPVAVLPEALAGTVSAATGSRLAVTGDAAARAVAALDRRDCASAVVDGDLPAVGALRAALRRWSCGERGGLARPLYLRPPDVTLAAELGAPGRS